MVNKGRPNSKVFYKGKYRDCTDAIKKELGIRDCQISLNPNEVFHILKSMMKLRSSHTPPKDFYCELIPDSEDDYEEVRFDEIFAKTKLTLQKKKKRKNGGKKNSKGRVRASRSPDIVSSVSGNNGESSKSNLRSGCKNGDDGEKKEIPLNDLKLNETEPGEGLEVPPSEEISSKLTTNQSNGKAKDKTDKKDFQDDQKRHSEPENFFNISSSEDNPNDIVKAEAGHSSGNKLNGKRADENKKKRKQRTDKDGHHRRFTTLKSHSSSKVASKRSRKVSIIVNPPNDKVRNKKHPQQQLKSSSISKNSKALEKLSLSPTPTLLRNFKIPRVAKPNPSVNRSPSKGAATVKAEIRKMFRPPLIPEPTPKLSVLSVLKEMQAPSQPLTPTDEKEELMENQILVDIEPKNDEITIIAEIISEKSMIVQFSSEDDDEDDSNNTNSSPEPMDWGDVLILHPEDRDLYRLFK